MRILSTTIAAAILSFSFVARADDNPERVWKAKCASCHGEAGDPKGKAQGEKMKVGKIDGAKLKDEEAKKAITEGIKREKDGVKQEMKAYKDLKPEVVDGLVKLMKSFK